MAPSKSEVKAFLKYYGRSITFFLVPLLLLPIPIAISGQEGRAGYLLLVMGVYWCTEVIPLGITALIPIALVPLFGIMSTKQVCNSYMESISVMLLGGMFVAIAVEKCNLHRRIATKVLLLIGTSPRWLMLGFMVPTWFLSMWINNTATTAMMMPIVQEVLQKLQDVDKKVKSGQLVDQQGAVNGASSPPSGLTVPETITKAKKKGHASNIELTKVESTADLVPNELSGHASDVSDVSDVSDTEETDVPRAVFSLEVPSDTGQEEESPTANQRSQGVGTDLPQIQQEGPADLPQIQIEPSVESGKPETEEELEKKKKFMFLEKALILCVAYAANAGGTGTIIGTTPNLVLKGQADQIWQDHGYSESPVNFATWMVLGFPISLLNLIVIWVWLEVYFIGPKEFFRVKTTAEDKAYEKSIRFVIKKEYEKLGSFKTDEIQLLVLFVVLVIFWFMRSPDFIPGWSDLFQDGNTSDAIPVVAVCVLMFAIPVAYPYKQLAGRTEYLLDWESIKQKFAWDVVLLVGGGFALAESTSQSGLSAWIGRQMSSLGSLPDAILVVVLGLIVTLITQVTSNVASATLLLPIGASMAQNLGKNPLYLMFCITVAVQYAFMLPVATPPNAVAFTTGKIKVMDMVKAGVLLNVFCVLVMTMGIQTWIYAFFELDVIPWDDTTAPNATDIPVL